MTRFLLAALCAVATLGACDSVTAQRGGADTQTGFAAVSKPKPGEAVATFASGCFWTTEHVFDDVKGVHQAISGYSGGTVPNPTYEQVAGKGTGHAESVQVYYDPQVISYADLLRVFFAEHDPTTVDRQGPDEGDEYRSAIFYRTPQEKAAIEAAIAATNAAKKWPGRVVTQVVPFRAFYPAETYHQGYAIRHPENPYLSSVSQPRYDKCRAALPQLFKPE